MYRPTRFTAVNFRSYEKLDIQIAENALTFIEGNNIDIGASSNGSGKSSIVKGIGWCLTGQTDKSVSAKQYVRKGTNLCETNLYLENARLDELIRIQRTVGLKKAVKVKIWLNDNLVGDAYDSKSAQVWLEGKVGISFKDINQFLFISQENRFSFLTATDGERKKVIGSIAGFDVLDQKYNKAAEALKTYDGKLSTITAKVNKTLNQIEVYEELVSEYVAPKDWSQDVIDAEKKVENAKKEVEKIQSSQSNLTLDKPDLRDLSDLEDRVSHANGELLRDKSNLQIAENEVINIRSRISESTVQCPTCKTEFGLDFDIEEESINLSKKMDYVGDLEVRVFESEGHLKGVKELLSDAKEKNSKLSEDYLKNVAKNRALNDLITEARQSELICKQTLSKAIANVNDSEEKKAEHEEKKRKIAELKKSLAEAKVKQDKLSNQVGELQYWKSALSASGEFRSHLARRALRAIEHQINSFLKEFKIGMSIEIEGYSAKANGDLSDKISIEVLKDDGSRMKVEECSGGQQARLNICSIVAMAQFINSRPNTEGLSLILLDEVMDSLDAHGIRSSEQVLRDLGDLSVIAISHQPAFGQTSNKISVVYENGISFATQT